jgi:CPA1 family monovalent cation:H+ antiporter
MDPFQVLGSLLVLAAVFGWLNHRYLGLPTTIGLMVVALVFSLALLVGHAYVPELERGAARLLGAVDFDRTLLHGFLFAGALHVDLGGLRRDGVVIGILATVGVLLSTAIVGALVWLVGRALGLPLPLLSCLLFGALISPTDPIAVLGMLKSLHVPAQLETRIAGESLFNDGVAVVVFLGLLEAARAGAAPLELTTLLALFLKEAGGGLLFGVAAGMVAYLMLKRIDDYPVEIMISLALVTGGYALADRLHLSAPLAMVAAGLLIGNHGRAFAMSERTREHLDTFWELVDEILNALLFVVLGLEILVLALRPGSVIAGLAAIPVVLGARLVATGLPIRLLARVATFTPHTVKILTWAGLRGGISVALALSLRDHLPAPEIDDVRGGRLLDRRPGADDAAAAAALSAGRAMIRACYAGFACARSNRRRRTSRRSCRSRSAASGCGSKARPSSGTCRCCTGSSGARGSSAFAPPAT